MQQTTKESTELTAEAAAEADARRVDESRVTLASLSRPLPNKLLYITDRHQRL